MWCQTATVDLPTAQGNATLDITAAAYADPAARRVRVFYRVNSWDTDFANLLRINGTRTLRMRLNCDNQCGVDGRRRRQVPGPDGLAGPLQGPSRRPAQLGELGHHLSRHRVRTGARAPHLWQFQGTLKGSRG